MLIKDKEECPYFYECGGVRYETFGNYQNCDECEPKIENSKLERELKK